MKPAFMKKYPTKIPNIVKITDKEEAMIEHKPKVCYYWHGNKRQLARDVSGFYNGLQFLTTDKFMLFLKNIPLKVTLATRSDFPRRFEQVFRSKNKDIFANVSIQQHGEENAANEQRTNHKARVNSWFGRKKELIFAIWIIHLFPKKIPKDL